MHLNAQYHILRISAPFLLMIWFFFGLSFLSSLISKVASHKPRSHYSKVAFPCRSLPVALAVWMCYFILVGQTPLRDFSCCVWCIVVMSVYANSSIFLDKIASCTGNRCGSSCHIKLFSFCHVFFFSFIREHLTANMTLPFFVLWPVIYYRLLYTTLEKMKQTQ